MGRGKFQISIIKKNCLLILLFSFLNFNAHAETYSFGSLKKLIETKNLTTIEATLQALPEFFRSKYALVFNSRSLQSASFEDPRVLLYQDGGTFIASFNGNETQKAYDSIETTEFDEATKEFNYREIHFPAKNEKNGKVIFSEANPDRCIKCHGLPTRPIWDTYPLWPGVYGERYHSNLSDPEREGIKKFLERQPTHPRYQYLKQVEVFTNKETFFPSSQNRYENAVKESPNEELSRFLSWLNGKRILKLVKAAPEFQAYRFALLASLKNECDAIEQFFPETVRKNYLERFQKFKEYTNTRNAEQEVAKEYRAVSFGHIPKRKEIDQKVLTPFRFLVETGLELSTQKWSTALEVDTYDFSGPQNIEGSLELQLLNQLGGSDPELKKMALKSRVSLPDEYCSYLKKRSLSSLSTLPKVLGQDMGLTVKANQKANTAPLMLKTCIECHQGSVGPALPFADETTLSERLNIPNKYPRGSFLQEILYRLKPSAGADRMPRGFELSIEDQEALENYFNQLAGSEQIPGERKQKNEK